MCRTEELVFLKSELRSFLVKRKTSAEHSAQTSLFVAGDRALQSALFNSSFLLLTFRRQAAADALEVRFVFVAESSSQRRLLVQHNEQVSYEKEQASIDQDR